MRAIVPECRRCHQPMRRHSVQTVQKGLRIPVYECEKCGRVATAESAIEAPRGSLEPLWGIDDVEAPLIRPAGRFVHSPHDSPIDRSPGTQAELQRDAGGRDRSSAAADE
jgi:hypothetical protein